MENLLHKNTKFKYILGLDIGIASIGYSVVNIDDNKIELMGVPGFERAEIPKTGESPAVARRMARGTRRTIRRRAGRMRHIKELLVNNIINENSFNLLFERYNHKLNPWDLRAKAIEEELTNEELSVVLYHMGKHRGFKSNRKVTTEDKKSDDGKAKAAIEKNKAYMQEKNYKTIGEMIANDPKFENRKRNSTDDYTNTIDREMLLEEIDIILNKQKEFNSKITNDFIEEYKNILNQQLPYAKGEDILKMVGKCTLIPSEPRGAKMTYTSERFTLLQRVNNLKYFFDGNNISLTPKERNQIIELAYNNSKVTYKQLRNLLNLEETARFSGLQYKRKKDDGSDELKSEDATFIELKGNNILKKAFVNNYNTISNDTKDTIVTALTFYKSDNDIREYLIENNISNSIIEIALGIPEFKKVSNISIIAMKQLMPYLEEGKYYSEAVEICGFVDPNTEKYQKLPVIETEDLKNPVMIRAITQTRKVINSIIEIYGSPHRIHIELARDMGKTYKERQEIDKAIESNTNENRNRMEFISNRYNKNPNSTDLLKYRLYKEQSSQCAYSQEPLDLDLIMSDDNYCQIDHILPYSRSFDNSISNKVLVLNIENQNKRNRTPHEYFGNDTELWDTFEAWVNTNIRNLAKRRKLLIKDYDKKDTEFLERNLKDTQYINRFLSNLLTKTLIFNNEDRKKTVVCLKGGIIHQVRNYWGIKKFRDEDDTHHAVDATIIACLTDKNIQAVTKYVQNREINSNHIVDHNTGEVIKERCPKPWETFREDLLSEVNYYLQNTEIEDNQKSGRIFISRMPIRKHKGAFHKETIRSLRKNGDTEIKVFKKALQDLKKDDLTKIYNPESDTLLVKAIISQMEEFDYNGKEAFNESFYKPKSDGTNGHLVKSIKLFEENKSGVEIRKGIADNDNIVRTDVFTDGKKFYLIPVYTWHVAQETLPNKAIVAHKNEENWLEMTDKYTFKFSLYPYDLVHVKTTENYMGYYRGIDRSTGVIVLSDINNNNSKPKRLGVGRAKILNKYTVDMLGNFYIIKGETRQYLGEQ